MTQAELGLGDIARCKPRKIIKASELDTTSSLNTVTGMVSPPDEVSKGETDRDSIAPLEKLLYQQEEIHTQFSQAIKEGIIDAIRELVGEDVDQLRRQILQRDTRNFLNPEPHERLKYALKKLSVVDNATLDHLENITNDCWRMIPVVGGIVSHHSRRYVLEQLDTVTRLLESSQSTTVHKRLCSIAGKLSLIVANILSNMRDYNTSKAYYEISIEAAQEANDPHLQAVSLVRLSFNSTRNDRPEMALPLILTAEYLMKKSDKHTTVTTRAWIAAALAEVYANLKDARSCFTALEYADAQNISMVLEDDIYHTTFSPSLLSGYKGICYILLRLSEDAEKVLSEALTQLPESSTYRKGYILSDLARSYVQQGKLEEMYKSASDALIAAVQTNAPEVFQRVAKLRNDFGSWTSISYIKNLETQIHDLEHHFYGVKGKA